MQRGFRSSSAGPLPAVVARFRHADADCVGLDQHLALAGNRGRHLDIFERRRAAGAARFDAQTGEYVDMVKAGIIDPTKVVRLALQNAASVAGLLVTTEAMVAEKPKKETTPAMPPGGGMDGMDDY